MKKFLLLLALISLSTLVSAQVIYSVDAGIDEAKINTTAVLECDEESSNCPVNSWALQWNIPESSTVKSITDSQGEIEDYERVDNILQIETNKAPRRTSERIQINVVEHKAAEEVAEGLYTRTISLSGFPGKRTSGEITLDNLLSSKISRSFRKSYENDSVSFTGLGAGNIRLNFGEGSETNYYSFFGSERNASLAYRIAVGTTGLRQSYPLIPVAVLNDEKYDQRVSDWSQGEYSSELIRVRSNLDENFQPVMAEETVHAFHDEALSHYSTSSTWLDEGIGSYTQSLVRKKLLGDKKTRSLFGEETTYTVQENNSRYLISKPSNGDREVLWSYYEENQSFMKYWNPTKVDADIRAFGYAYSELIIRNYVANGGRVRNLYKEINTTQTIESDEEKWNYLSQYLDLTPCKFENREKFDNCLNRVNDYNYGVYSASEIPEVSSESIQVQELETPNYTEGNVNSLYSGFHNRALFEQSFVNSILEFLNSLLSDL